MKKLEPIKRRKLAHEVRDRLLDMIQTGELSEGDQMPSEHELMKHYGVGRPAIREALQSLEAMGMISIQHGEKARVRKVTAEDVLHQIEFTTSRLLSSSAQNIAYLMEARGVFEHGVTLLATNRASDDCIKKLEKRLEYMKNCKGDRAKFLKADQAFHITIAEISKNPIFLTLSQAMFKWLSGHHIDYHQNVLGIPDFDEETIEEHRAVFDLITKRDAKGAADMISAHILRAHKLFKPSPDKETEKADQN